MNCEIKFLVVDDFGSMRKIVKGFLSQIGYDDCDEAEDGVIALHKLKNNKVDFIICDLNMPNMNGFQLLAEIKQIPTLKHIPVLMVTAEARREDIVIAGQAGAAGYIVKPFTKATLEYKVTLILQKVGFK